MLIKNQYYFFYPEITDSLIIEGDKVFQISNVLRLKPGNKIVLQDGKGKKGYYTIESIAKKDIHLRLINVENKEFSDELILIIAALKKEKLEWVMQKSVELGVTQIWIFQGDNSVSKLNDFSKKKKRYEKILIESFEQSMGFFLPELVFFNKITEIKKNKLFSDLKIFYTDRNAQKTFKDFNLKKNTAVIIGPEGGFTQKEITLFNAWKCENVLLANTLLRSETAAIAALSQIQLLRN